MARIPFENIMAGLEDALAYAAGDSARGTAHEVKVADVDITYLREKLGLSQDRFATWILYKAPLGHTIFCCMLDFGETHSPKEALP